MTIGIDISQIVYEKTGVATYLEELIPQLIAQKPEMRFILFGSSMRNPERLYEIKKQYSKNPQVDVKIYPFPPLFLDFLWNRLHIFPIELLIGNVDVFLSSDWTQPPTLYAKSATVLFDLIVYKFPEEMSKQIVETHKRRLRWVKEECNAIFCISQATKKDAMDILKIPEDKLFVTYLGFKGAA